jgi:hypothetical protein
MNYLEIELGTTVPHNEPCSQVGSPDYSRLSRMEATAFIEQIKREIGNPPPGVSLRIKSNPHDFGSYLDVVVRFDDDSVEAVAYACNVEEHMPMDWDDDAIVQLTELGYNIDR